MQIKVLGKTFVTEIIIDWSLAYLIFSPSFFDDLILNPFSLVLTFKEWYFYFLGVFNFYSLEADYDYVYETLELDL